MTGRPYVLLSCAVSADGYLDDTTPARLVLSSDADLDRVDEVRAGVDAILVGAATIRRDDPRLAVRSPRRRAARTARGLPPSPAKVTLTASGDLDPRARFFTDGEVEKLVYCAAPVAGVVRGRLAGAATVVEAGRRPHLPAVLADLAKRRVRRLMVEGGADILRQFLETGLADELQLAVAPFFVGDPAAPRFATGLPRGGTVPPGGSPFPVAAPGSSGTRIPGRPEPPEALAQGGAVSPGAGARRNGPGDPMTLAEVRRLGGVVLLRYLLGEGGADGRWLREAIELSRRCPPSARAYSVGAVIVDAAGDVVATGYSREQDARDHAEEVALRKAPRRLDGATLYSSLEPCSTRASRPRTCTELILAAGIHRVVFAWREPALFADCQGAEKLAAAGVTVVEMPELADHVRAVNTHLLDG
jgi:riboflavin-specific deaminase-like protein